jgi:hypothetical protein
MRKNSELKGKLRRGKNCKIPSTKKDVERTQNPRMPK